MALALLESADGEQALPAFTGLEAMTAVERRRAAGSAPRPARSSRTRTRESLAAVVIDPGAPHSQILWCERPEATRQAQPAQARRWWRRG